VRDTTPPVWTWFPIDVEGMDCGAPHSPFDVGRPTARDDCSAEMIIYSDRYDDSGAHPVCVRTWVAQDVCGNQISRDQRIVFQDTIPPAITCPGDVAILSCESTDPDHAGHATATDTCDDDVDVSYSDTVTPGICDNAVIDRVWTAVDDGGNVAECTQIITLMDERPTVTCPPDITIEAGQSTAPDATGRATGEDPPCSLVRGCISSGND